MKRFATIFVAIALMAVAMPVGSSARSREKNRAEVISRGKGYYKDVFMDSGIRLSSRRSLPSIPFLGMELESFVSASKKNLTAVDTLLQKKIFCGCEEDTNGRLLYPDGAPRYRMIYVNGGNAAGHGRTLTEEGRKNIVKFVKEGGSYLGSCAGAYLASAGGYGPKPKPRLTDIYLGLWPAYAHSTMLRKSRTDMLIDKKSPLWRYYDFGKDCKVAAVSHNGGCYAFHHEDKPFPSKGEVLSRYIFEDSGRVKIDGKPSAWAYKENKYTGRAISCGSHPEGVKSGERLEYMAAMVLYAMEGNGIPRTKGELKAGEVREMNKRTEDNNPAFTRIGDKQYHHFEFKVPKKCKKAILTLEGYEGENNFDLTLCTKRGELAFEDNATSKKRSKGCNKQLVISKPKVGKWYVSVLCETTVEAMQGKYGTEYSGRTDVLNGVPYKISVKYE